MHILDFIICDDIREEVGGKLTIVGAFNDRIVYETTESLSFPESSKLSIYIKLLIEKHKEEKLIDSFRIKLFNVVDDKIYFDKTFKIQENHPFGVAFPFIAKNVDFSFSPGQAIGLETSIFSNGKVFEQVLSPSLYYIIERKKVVSPKD